MNLPTDRVTAPVSGGLSLPVRLAVALTCGALLGAGVAAASPGAFWNGWLAATVLLVPALFALLSAWQWGGGAVQAPSSEPERFRAPDRIGAKKLLAWLVALAFILRLGIGIGLSRALPVWGYAEKEQQAGYLFRDAYNRDDEAWGLAKSSAPLWHTFTIEFATDQYGGLLALNALVYRVLSPDAQRPFLILILGAFFAALGVPFLWRAAKSGWNERVAALACWIYVLYPDAIFFGSSQLREPFVVGLSAIALWAVLTWNVRERASWLGLLGSLAGMALISSRVAAAVAGFLGLLFLLEYVVTKPDRRWRILGWAALGVGILFVLGFSWEWFRSSVGWDMLVTKRVSGALSQQIKNAHANDLGTLAILVSYGVARPMLPAAVTEPSNPFWRTIAIIRSLGWYALAPFLVYGLFSVWREIDARQRRRAIWLVLTVAIWIVVASARGGADVTDNPRYRSLFIVWLALLAAWAVDWALAHHDAWLWRWIAVEAIFLGFLTSWYLSRYYKTWGRLAFWEMIALVAGLSGLVLVGGWAWDRWQMRLK